MVRPTLIDYTPSPIGAFPKCYTLTRAADVMIVPTPGHSEGHQSVILRENNRDSVFFAGDASFSDKRLLKDEVGGIVYDSALQRRTSALIRQHLNEMPMVYLPSHDADAPRRLANREITTVRGQLRRAV